MIQEKSSPRSRAIYIDIDDVLSHTIAALDDLLHQHHDRRVPYESIKQFDLGISFGLKADELRTFLDLAHEPQIIKAILPVEGAVAGLEHWSKAGYEVRLLTGRPPTTEVATRHWLETHGVPHASLTFVDKYGRAGGWTEDTPTLTLSDIATMEFCLAVEDSLEVAAFIAENLDIDVALVDHPWNRATEHL
ncbi:MAG: putative HAD superfamily protein, partial [Myxococcota bacterium]